MAGEIEEPFRFNFQADLLHSGSISFGRFESESLSWERRSSFSHNRYLEEVEKYSKPGSVTEKKAYFEAHFRRKALLKQSSSEGQNGREFRTSENDDSQDLQESENGNESKHFTCFDESPYGSCRSKYDEETEIQKYEKENVETLCADNDNASSHVTSFDESPCSLGYEGVEILECEREDFRVFSVAPKDVSMINTVDHMVSGPEHLKFKETHQSGTENVVLVKSEENTRETLNDIVVMVDVASEANDSSLNSHSADKDDDSANSGPHRIISSKVRLASEMKQTKPKLKAHANVAQVQRNISSEASNGSGKAKTRESEGLLMKEKEKKSPRPASPFAPSGRKTSKSEESSMSVPKVKILPPKKSIVKEYRSGKTTEAKSSVLENSFPQACQTANRSKQTISLSKSHINQGAAGFTFKSDQRAERRKEEKKVVEMTQSRKSLNFKATPMPFFYKESTRCSDQNKVISTSKTPNRPRTPSMATHTNRFSSNSTASSGTRPSSSASLTNRNRPSEPTRKSCVPEKRIQEKKKDSSSQKQKEPEATKGPRARDTLRKDTKGVQVGSGPKLGYLTVSVAT